MAIGRAHDYNQCDKCSVLVIKPFTRCITCQIESDKLRDSDPNGIDQHAPGAKLDAEKPRMGLVMDGFALALLKVGEIGTYGAKKYSDNGWQSVPNGEARYKDALLRHLLLASQEELDPESAMLHLSHACWNCLAALQLHLEKRRS